MHATVALGLLSALSPALGLDADGWSKQSIYQVLVDRFARTDGSTTAACDASLQQYCGGSWQGLISKLDYIQGMGFTAIWISPIVAQMEGTTSDGESYHGYWAQDIWSVNSRFGTENDLKQLSDELHRRGMYLMVDVVANHMAFNGCGTCVDYSIFNPFNSVSFFHPFCLIDYSDEYSSQIQTCWQGSNAVPLPDLRTEDADVRAIWTDWIAETVSKYKIDGLRIDSAKHVEQDFHRVFEAAAGVFTMGEVLHGDPDYCLPYQNYMSGVLNYPAYFWAKRAFASPSPGDFAELAWGLARLSAAAVNTSYLGNFIENHDQERFFPRVTSDLARLKNAIAFNAMVDGIPVVYQGQEQRYGGDVQEGRAAMWLSGFDTGTDLYAWIARLNAVRAWAISRDGGGFVASSAHVIYAQGPTMALRKGNGGRQIVSVFSNAGESAGDYSISLSSETTPFNAGQALVDTMSCSALTVGRDGVLSVTISGGLPRIFYPRDQLQGSGICPKVDDGSSGSDGSGEQGGCSVTAVAVTFNVLATTEWGDTIKVVGTVDALGNWDALQAVTLSASEYTASNPVWTGSVSLTSGTVVEYKFIVVDSSGSVTWEADPNRTLSVASCETAMVVSSTWKS